VDLLTVKDLAQAMGLGESTVRFWRDRYADFFPYVGEGKRRRYRPEAVEVLRFIAERANRSENSEAIAEALARVFPRSITIAEESQRSNAATQQGESQHNRSDPPAVPAVDVPAILAALVPLADRYVAALERQAAALETIADRLALPGPPNRPQNAPKCETRANVHGRAETSTHGPHIASPSPRGREEIMGEVARLRGEGLGAGAIATAMRRAGWPTLSGRGAWGKGSVKRIIKGEMKA
jgi:DNA-binding transcriptional MerR regulator